MVSNWYGAPYSNLGDSPPSSTRGGFAYWENTDPVGGTQLSNMRGAIQNDINSHTGGGLTLTNTGSGSQNGFVGVC